MVGVIKKLFLLKLGNITVLSRPHWFLFGGTMVPFKKVERAVKIAYTKKPKYIPTSSFYKNAKPRIVEEVIYVEDIIEGNVKLPANHKFETVDGRILEPLNDGTDRHQWRTVSECKSNFSTETRRKYRLSDLKNPKIVKMVEDDYALRAKNKASLLGVMASSAENDVPKKNYQSPVIPPIHSKEPTNWCAPNTAEKILLPTKRQLTGSEEASKREVLECATTEPFGSVTPKKRSNPTTTPAPKRPCLSTTSKNSDNAKNCNKSIYWKPQQLFLDLNSVSKNGNEKSRKERLSAENLEQLMSKSPQEVINTTDESLTTTSDVIVKEQRKEFGVMTGFPNFGLNCYLNSAAQCLLRIPATANDIILKISQESKKLSGMSLPPDTLISHVSKILIGEGDLQIHLRKIAEISSYGEAKYNNHSEEDVQEFIANFYFKFLAEEISTYGGKALASAFTNFFQLRVRRKNACNKCQTIEYSNPELWDMLTLVIPENIQSLSLQGLVESSIEPKNVDRLCSKCKAKDVTPFQFIEKPPECVLLHLQRYRVNNAGDAVKVDSRIKVNKYLRFERFLNNETPASNDENPEVRAPLNSIENSIGPVPSKNNEAVVKNPFQQTLQNKTPATGRNTSFRNISKYMMKPITLKGGVHRPESAEQEDPWPSISASPIAVDNSTTTEDNLDTKKLEEQGLHIHGLSFDEELKIAAERSLEQQQEQDELDLKLALEKSLTEATPLPPAVSHVDESEFFNDDEEIGPYQLMGVICHHGLTVNSGHYTAMVFNTELNSWYRYNDESVTKLNLHSFKDLSTHEGYMFFYRKIKSST